MHKAWLTVQDPSESHVEATEGRTGPARFVWERCRYEWPQAGVVTATVIDSDALLPGSAFELRASPHEGGSPVEVIMDRRFRSSGWGRVGYALEPPGQ